MPNSPEHDPDIQLMPLFAFTSRFFSPVYSTYHRDTFKLTRASRFLVSIQHYYFYVVSATSPFSNALDAD